jgi:hypothetical protein
MYSNPIIAIIGTPNQYRSPLEVVMALNPRLTFLSALVLISLFSALAAYAQEMPAQPPLPAPQPSVPPQTTVVQALPRIDILKLPECSLSKTNENCKLIIDRRIPVSPSTVQMYSNQSVTVVVKNPNAFERYFLDYTTGQATLSPDVTSSIVQGLLPSLAKASYRFDTAKAPNPCASAASSTPAPGTVERIVVFFQDCMSGLAADATGIYRRLEPFVAPDSMTPISVAAGGPVKADGLGALLQPIADFEKSEVALSSKITAIAGDKSRNYTANDLAAIQQLTNLQKLADAVASDLLGYSQRISEVPTGAALQKNGFQDCSNVLKPTEGPAGTCVSITSKPDNDAVYDKMVTRTITYSLDALNLISNPQEATPDPSKKKLLATIAINFADTPTKFPGSPSSPFRWELSAGAFFSSLAVRSFNVAPTFTNGVITTNMVAQNILRPTVVPFAAVNYRITNDLNTRWKTNFYWTGTVGINPNTVSADFATGPSLSWRALMVSFLCHFGHDTKLTQGFVVGQNLGPTFSGMLPTKTYWTEAFAIGISVRVPALTGR